MIWHFLLPFFQVSPKENVTVWWQRSLLFVCHPIGRQSQVTMRRRSWSLATMETQLEMLGILYSVALLAENGVRSVIEFFKTFQRALQEISKPEPISECIRRIGGWCWDLSLKTNLNRPFTCRHFGSGICWFGCSVLSAMAWGIMGAPRGQEIWCLRCPRVQSQSLVMVIEGDNYVDVYHNSSLGFVRTFFFGKRYRNWCQNNNSKYGTVDLEGPRTNGAIFLKSFQRRSKFAQLQSLAGFGARNGTWNETCAW